MLKKQTGNMYDFVYDTKNPLCGPCSHQCKYCYVDRMKKQYPVIRNKYSGEIRLDKKVLKGKLKEVKFYFIQSMGDLFAENVPESMIIEVLNWCFKFPYNTYLFQSKNPSRFSDFVFPENTILGTTIESNWDHLGISKAPGIRNRVNAMIGLKKAGCRVMLTIEPVLDFNIVDLVRLIKAVNPEWINLGADSGGNKLPEPSKEKLLELISRVEIRQKKNLKRLLK